LKIERQANTFVKKGGIHANVGIPPNIKSREGASFKNQIRIIERYHVYRKKTDGLVCRKIHAKIKKCEFV